MLNKFYLIDNGRIENSIGNIANILRKEELYKALSIFYTLQAGLIAPNTAILLNMDIRVVKMLIDMWGLPLMIRLDYQSLKSKKPIGGIPLKSLSTIVSVSDFLHKGSFIPILHPNLDRMDDIYSAGILLNLNDDLVHFEFVGKGFDASDLRLGFSTPHEHFDYDLAENKILKRSIISESEYDIERYRRQNKLHNLNKYVEYVNQRGSLLDNLDRFDSKDEDLIPSILPYEYTPIPKRIFDDLTLIAMLIKNKVIVELPISDHYIISLSYMKKYGWVLWDIYGSWFNR